MFSRITYLFLGTMFSNYLVDVLKFSNESHGQDTSIQVFINLFILTKNYIN
jgi:hypothetical protein